MSTHSYSCFDMQVFILSQLASEKRPVVKKVMPRLSGGPVTCWMPQHIVRETPICHMFPNARTELLTQLMQTEEAEKLLP